MRRFVAVLLTTAIASVASLAGDCAVDSDCPAGTGCIIIKSHSYNPSSVIGKCTPKQLCRGSSIGNCPSFNAPSAPGGYLQTQCVFINTTRLRGINCCTGNAESPSTGGGNTESTGVGNAAGNSTARRLANDTIGGLNNLPVDGDDCYQCYRDPAPPKGTTGYYAGQFFCVPQQECKSSSVFPLACSGGNMCSSGPNELCNYHGTCTPLDINDPKGSYGCACNRGFGGGQCEAVVSDACTYDCGDGNTKGTCVDGQCVCKKGWTGPQCTLCTTNAACGGGTCNPGSGQCSCPTNTTTTYQKIANVCYGLGTTSGAKSSCSGVVCGPKGICMAGSCVCSHGCAGTVCKACADETCESCSGTAAVRPSILVALGAALLALSRAG
ncbi:hypothetical protein ACHHYP_20131 [Achlya hypogyna]|uniref:EGF-like domain-containing protein n=1 Tax=Achlya hypogyna TaxID=1202772 RepID=A0A1V9Z3R5_ACHHY|nr:hypothetical protein ACHHYP_20131 [Achlya hypogyna]